MTDAPGAIPPSDPAPSELRAKSLGKNTAIMASGTLVSRVLGLIRNAMLVAAIGVNVGVADAYDIANKLPNTLYAVVAAGVINAALVPQILKAFGRRDGKRTVDRILTVGTVISLGVTVVLTIAAPLLVMAYAPSNWSPELMALAVAFALWCIPQLLFYAIYTLFGQVLNAKEQFGPYMWAPVVNNIIGIVGLAAYLVIFGPQVKGVPALTGEALTIAWTPFRIALIAGVATLGIAAQALILIWPMVRGGYRFAWVWRGPKGELSGVRTVISWALGAVLIEQLGVLWATRVAAAAPAAALAADPSTPTGSIAGNAAYFQGLLIYLVPHSLITVSIVTALTTSMSRLWVANDITGLRAEISRGLRTIGVFTIFATVVTIAIAPSITRLMNPSASPAEVTSVSQVLIALALGLAALGAMVLIKRVYFILEDAKAIFMIHIPMTLVLIGVSLAVRQYMDPKWWVVGVALGLSLSNVMGVLLRTWGLRNRLGGLDGRNIMRTHVKALAGAVPAGFAGWGLTLVLPDPVTNTGFAGFAAAVVNIAASGILMVVVYALILRLLRTPELGEVMSPVTRRISRRVR
ncbi:murein biosynthesis integral membrane protein MurJ [Demequina aurantiaca]|uniref:murein biosynthesis integral membrane protein MurJ n=1 Tax=Demequina aurantiaca TaxID=676200 RepID=UPI0007853B4A|nr:lipid II flippase MurJ [Demequina aurantiaca]